MSELAGKELKEKIQSKMAGMNLWTLATINDEGKPWVRYVTPTRSDEDLTIWMATSIISRKAEQIRKYPEVHMTVGVANIETAESYLQIQGRAEILKDKKSKEYAWQEHLGSIFSGPDDPNFCVCRIRPYRIEYQTMGMVPPAVWEV